MRTVVPIWLLAGGTALGALAARASADVATRGVVPPDATPPANSRRVSRRFDPIFREFGRGLPLAYLRSLAKRESNLDPADSQGPAWGLLQITEVVRRDYNERNGTRYARKELLDPRINTTIAAELLTRIIASYRRNHPKVENLQLDWANPRFVELLTFGWNAGYSERGGLGRVVRYLKDRGIRAITVDIVTAAAETAGAARFLSMPQRVAWSKSVARLHASERLRDDEDRRTEGA